MSSDVANFTFYIDVKSILDVIFESFRPVTRRKASFLGQQTLQVSSVSTHVFRSSSPKGLRSSTNPLEGGSNIAKMIKETLALLNLSGSKNFAMNEDDGTLNDFSSTFKPHSVCLLSINLCDNIFSSLSSTIVMQAMVTNVSFVRSS